MPLVYLVIDHWSTFEEELYRSGVKRFFVTDLRALKPAVERGCDIIVDNGAYRYGRAIVSWSLYAARLGLKYILPDVLGDPARTIEMHARFANQVSEKELANGFVVLQGSSYQQCIEQLEKLRELGIVKKYVAFGGPRELRRLRSKDEKIVAKLHRYCRRRGYWLHVLGRARRHCDSFDTAGWGYRLLDQKLRGERYSIKPVLKFIERYERQHQVGMPL